MQRIFRRGFRKIAHLIWKTRLSSKINFTWTVKLDGKKVKVPIIRRLGTSNLTVPEAWMIDLFKNILKAKKGAFLDVGVNLGQSLIKLKCVAPDMEYIGFEPNPVCVFYVKELIRKNRFKKCTILPVGLYDRDSLLELEFFDPSDVDSSASIIKNFRPGHTIYDKQYVPVFSFGRISEALDLRDIGVIKIDVEGAESEVMKSLYPAISRCRPMIMLEILPVYSEDNETRKERTRKIEQMISELNYLLFRIIKTDNGAYAGLKRLDAIGVHSDLEQCDYVLVPEESEKEIIG
jgi:FkbM family methyltransferase